MTNCEVNRCGHAINEVSHLHKVSCSYIHDVPQPDVEVCSYVLCGSCTPDSCTDQVRINPMQVQPHASSGLPASPVHRDLLAVVSSLLTLQYNLILTLVRSRQYPEQYCKFLSIEYGRGTDPQDSTPYRHCVSPMCRRWDSLIAYRARRRHSSTPLVVTIYGLTRRTV